MLFAENLKRLREDKNFSKSDMAKKLDITPSAYGAYELKRREPSFDMLCKIAEALHVTTDELLGYKLNEFDFWINKIINLLDMTVATDGNKISITQKPLEKSHPIFPTVVFTKSDFIDFMRGIDARTKEDYEHTFSNRLFDYLQMAMMLTSQTENYKEFIKRLFPYETTEERKTDHK